MGPRLVERGEAPPVCLQQPECPASMGPRLVERGKWGNGLCRKRSNRLQWGRAWLSAERVGNHIMRGISRKASMGPRLVERGKPLPLGNHHDHVQHASMGPRLVERGKSQQRSEPLSFGGASMGPRLVERGKVRAGRESEVSFGRLQWGRAWLSAERCDDRNLISPTMPSFNGAAAWLSAERRRPIQSQSSNRASMGPRLVERGKVVYRRRLRKRGEPLQWGRAWLSAER